VFDALRTFFDRLTPRPAINHGQTFQPAHFKRNAIGQRIKAAMANGSTLTRLINVIHSRGHQTMAGGGNFLRWIFLFQQNYRRIKPNSALGA
jgi:hypothetical protein